MNDPYQVLGISPNASDEEVKAAYRELARKYHPDHYVDNPLADLASEKMKEINDAYDRIMTARKNGSSTGGGQSYSSQAGRPQGSSQLSDIRRLINARRITEAEELLDGIPSHTRDAEWHFLKGCVQYNRGWLDDAYENFSRACQMDPYNQEYRATLNQLQWQKQTGRAPGSGYRTGGGNVVGGCSTCDICSTLYCADCCCECMGGDLIHCC